MKKTINFNGFLNTFIEYERQEQLGGYEGLKSLFNYLDNLENELGEEFELDVIGLCCDYTYYSNIDEYNDEYGKSYETYRDIDETIVIPVNDMGFIIQEY